MTIKKSKRNKNKTLYFGNKKINPETRMKKHILETKVISKIKKKC